MKTKSRTASIHHAPDSDELKGQLQQLQEMGFRVLRPNFHQIKVAKYNWFWSTDRITIDPCDRHPEKGFEAFVALIERNVRKKHRTVVLDFPVPSNE